MRLSLDVNGDQARKEINATMNAISDGRNKVRELKKEMRELAGQNQKDSKHYKDLAAALKEENAAIDANKKKLEEQRSKLSLNDMTIQELSSRIKTLKRNLELLRPGTKEWKQLNAELQKTSARLQHLKGSANAAKEAMAAISGAIAVIYGVARVFGGAVTTMKDFEQANADLSTILGKSVSDIQQLTDDAERLGRTTEYTASEVTGLQIELAKLGFKEGQIQTMEESVLHFATAVGADLPEAASLAGATLRMFGLSTKDTEDTLATLALATNKSALSFSFFETAMSTVGPVANTFGFSLKDTTALLGTLANAGFDASSAATATRNILLKLADANGDLAKALGGPVSTFDELIDGLQALDEKGIDLAGTLTDNRSVAAFNSFLSGVESTRTLREELEETDGVLKQIAEQRMTTLEGSLKKLSSAWEGFILKLKGSTGILKSIVDYLTEMVAWITPGNAHDKDVENTVDTITAGYGTAEGRAFVADRKVKELKSQLDKLDEDLEQAQNRRSRRRIEKEKKRIEKEMSVYQDAYTRLKASADAVAEDTPTTTTQTGSGNNYKTPPSDKEKSAAAKKAEQERKQQEQELKKAAEEAKKQREEVAKLEEKILQARIAAADNYNDKADAQLAVENARFKKEMEQLENKKGQLADYDQAVETLQRQHSNNLLKIELERQSAELKDLESNHKLRLAEIQKENEYELSLETTSSSRKLEIQRSRNVLIAKENKRFLDEQYSFLLKIVDAGEVGGVKLSMDQLVQYQTKLEEIRKQLQDADAALDNLTKSSVWSGTGDGALFGIKQSDWDTLFANLADGTLKAKDLQTILGGIGGAAQEGFKLANQAIQLTNAREKKALDDYKKGQDDRKSELEARHKAGLITEHQYNEEVAQMEADMQARQEEMELKQAQRTKTMSIVESIINTALGVSKTLAQWGVPAGLAPAAIMTAMGAAQTAMIAAQPVGYAEGGEIQVKRAQDGRSFRAKVEPGRRGYVDRPTILVGEEGPEYVIPAEALKNPQIRMVADTIESARRMGRLRSLRMEAISPVLAASGRAAGGYTSGAAATDTVVAMAELSRLSETVDRLNTVLENGIRADVSMLGKHGLVERINEYERAKNRGNLYDRDTNQNRSIARSRSGH